MLDGLRIGLLTASASRLGGGVFEAVAAQAQMIAALGGEPVIFALRDEASEQDRRRFGNCRVIHADVAGPRQVGFAPALVRELLSAKLDCLHLHGIWMYPSAAGGLWARRTGRPYLVSPHGMLDPWIVARGKWKKALARRAYERGSWRAATALHALTPREAHDIARESRREDSLVIPNAGPSPNRRQSPDLPDPVILYIGRIHPKKNLCALVAGWKSAQRPEGAKLVIAGWGEPDHVQELEQALAGNDGSVEFVGPVFGETKAQLLGSARFMILPSHSEGLPMALLEAWAVGLPTIQTGECNLPEGFSRGAALDCGYTADVIAGQVSAALFLPESRWQAMSAAALDLATTRFAPEVVARAWGQAYLTVCRGSNHA